MRRTPKEDLHFPNMAYALRKADLGLPCYGRSHIILLHFDSCMKEEKREWKSTRLSANYSLNIEKRTRVTK